MKKFLGLLCCIILFSANQSFAVESGYVSIQNNLTGEQPELVLNGTQYTDGVTNYHILPWVGGNVAYAAQDPTRRVVEKPSDPFIVKIDGKMYLMLKDNHDGKWDEKDILGFYDTPKYLFASLEALKSTPYSDKLTAKDLKVHNVRFALIDNKGKLLSKDITQDFDLNKLDYIDMKHLKKLANSSSDGVFGHFNVYLKDGRMIVGLVTFSDSRLLKNLF